MSERRMESASKVDGVIKEPGELDGMPQKGEGAPELERGDGEGKGTRSGVAMPDGCEAGVTGCASETVIAIWSVWSDCMTVPARVLVGVSTWSRLLVFWLEPRLSLECASLKRPPSDEGGQKLTGTLPMKGTPTR